MRRGSIHWRIQVISSSLILTACNVTARARTSPRCIVSLSVASDEYLYDALNGTERCYTVSFFAHDARTSRIATDLGRNIATSPAELEPLLTMNPMLIIGQSWSRLARVAQRYDVPTLTLDDAETLEDVERQTEELDATLAPSTPLAPAFRMRLMSEQRAIAQAPLCRLGRVLFYNPALRSAVGTQTMLDEILRTVAGANRSVENALGRPGHHVLAEEDIVRMNPDVVIIVDYRADARRADDASAVALPLALWRRNRTRNHESARTLVLDSALALTTSHRVLDTVQTLYRQCQSLCR